MRDFMVTLLICSVTMSAVAVLYMAFTPLLAKRYSEKWRYYAWIVILAGLIIPFRPHFGNAIVNVEIPGGAYLSEVVKPENTVTADDVTESIRNPVENNMFSDFTVEFPRENVPVSAGISENSSGIDMVTEPAEDTEPSVVSQSIVIDWWLVISAAWLTGMIGFLAYHIIHYYRFNKAAGRWSKPVADGQIFELFHNLKTEMNISKTVGLQVCPLVGSPLLIGLFRPRILLPKADLSENELYFILMHELVHYKRKDILYKCFTLIAEAVHWFNPIIHLMTKAINAGCELSCDAEVISGTDAETRQHYSETILAVARYRSKINTILSTNFYGGKKGMKNRILSIADKSKKKTGIIVICFALILTICTSLVIAANSYPNEYADNLNNDGEINLTDILDSSNNDNQEENITPDELMPISFSIPSIPAGNIVCIGKITLRSGYDLVYDALAESGGEFFISLSEDDDTVMEPHRLWMYYMGYNIKKGLSCVYYPNLSDCDKEYYVFVGSSGDDVVNVTGTVELRYNADQPKRSSQSDVDLEDFEDYESPELFESPELYELPETAELYEVESLEPPTPATFMSTPTEPFILGTQYPFYFVGKGSMGGIFIIDEDVTINVSVNMTMTSGSLKFNINNHNGDIFYTVSGDSNGVSETASVFLKAGVYGATVEATDAKNFEYSIIGTYAVNGESGMDEVIRYPASGEKNNQSYIWPLENNQTIMSTFETKITYTGETLSHNGVDIQANLDTPVMAASSGIVKEADYDYENGLYVIIDHGNGIDTLYACLNGQTVKEGDEVKQGDIIGNVGSTGHSTGPHLHFGILINDEFVDPLVYLP